MKTWMSCSETFNVCLRLFFCIFTQLSIDFGMCRYYNTSYIFILIILGWTFITAQVFLWRAWHSRLQTQLMSLRILFLIHATIFIFFFNSQVCNVHGSLTGALLRSRHFQSCFSVAAGCIKCGRMYIWGLQRRCGSIRGGSGSINDSSPLGFGPLQDRSPPAPPLLLLLLLSHIVSWWQVKGHTLLLLLLLSQSICFPGSPSPAVHRLLQITSLPTEHKGGFYSWYLFIWLICKPPVFIWELD